MIEVRKTKIFLDWVLCLRDQMAKARIAMRIDRLQRGNFGDWKSVGDGICEMRIDHGPGYRLYFTQRGKTVVLLLCGGDKGSQRRDIERARAMAREIDDGD